MDWIESDHKHLRPKSIHDPDILDQFGDDYMYFACIRFINSVRLASFLLLLQRLASCTAPSPDLPALHLLSLLLPTPPSLPVSKIKTASLRWHSPMLDDISAVKTWSKVNSKCSPPKSSVACPSCSTSFSARFSRLQMISSRWTTGKLLTMGIMFTQRRRRLGM
jgi:hypothetical protein